jgi:putative SOS response-associated peptidase YedK
MASRSSWPGLWSDAPDPVTGEIADSEAMVIGEANAAMRIHDHMPAILGTHAPRRWLEPGPLPAEVLAGMADPVPDAA